MNFYCSESDVRDGEGVKSRSSGVGLEGEVHGSDGSEELDSRWEKKKGNMDDMEFEKIKSDGWDCESILRYVIATFLLEKKELATVRRVKYYCWPSAIFCVKLPMGNHSFKVWANSNLALKDESFDLLQKCTIHFDPFFHYARLLQ